jgi:hypothetical protein
MDSQKFFNGLMGASDIVEKAAMICESMEPVMATMDDKTTFLLSSGIFSTLSCDLSDAFETLSAIEDDFKKAFDVKHPCHMNEDEKREYMNQRRRRA